MMRSKIMAIEMMLQSTSGTITYQEKMNVSVQEPNISAENSVRGGGSYSFSMAIDYRAVMETTLRLPCTARPRYCSE
jgi:hypothetical protein